MTRRLALATALLVLALAACSDDGGSTVQSPSAAPSTPTPAPTASASRSVTPGASPTFDGKVVRIRFAGGKVETSAREVSVKIGTQVLFEVFSDRDEELHVHGIDVKSEVTAGSTVNVVVRPGATGVFEVEFEKSKKHILDLRVTR